MHESTVEQEIKVKELEAYFSTLFGDSALYPCLFRLARANRPKLDEVRTHLAHLRTVAPTSFLFTRVSYGHSGMPVTQTSSADEDPDGHLSIQYGQELKFSGFFFVLGWRRLLEKFGFDENDLFSLLEPSPLIREDRTHFFKEGIRAHLNQDYVKSVHVLIPQVENTLQELLRFLHLPRSRRVSGQSGVTQLKNMGEVLRDERIVDTLDEDLRWFLTHLFIEKHGLNLRNDLSHVIAPADVFNEQVSAMVIQSIILLSAVRKEYIYLDEATEQAADA